MNPDMFDLMAEGYVEQILKLRAEIDEYLGIDADHTGTAGLAGLIQLTRDGVVRPDETVAVIFSGARRSTAAPSHPSEGGETLP